MKLFKYLVFICLTVSLHAQVATVSRLTNIAALRAVNTTTAQSGQQYSIGGYYVDKDGGGGTFIFVASSSAPDNGGTVIAPNVGTGRWFRSFSDSPNVKWFGAKQDGTYATSGNTENLFSGSDDTTALVNWNASAKATNSTGSHYGGSSLNLPFGVSEMNGNFIVNQHYTFIRGQGYGASIIHGKVSGNQSTPELTWLKGITGVVYNDLTSGGGLSDASIRTEQTNPRDYGVRVDFAEYQTFDNDRFENFGKAALLLGLYEGSFKNTEIYLCGVNQTSGGITPTVGSTPDCGDITFDSLDVSNTNRSNANNTFFDRITFSGCFGTWIDFNAFTGGSSGGTTTGIFMDGVYGENNPAGTDGGGVDELPIIYVNHGDLLSMANTQITMNTTGVTRQTPFIRMDEIGGSHLELVNFNLQINPTSGIGVRLAQRLGCIAFLNGANTDLTIETGMIYDVSDSVGYASVGGRQPLFIGTGSVHPYALSIYYYSAGTQRGTNVFGKTLNVNGDMEFVPYVNPTGANNAAATHYKFNNGQVTLIANALPTTNDRWMVGDKVEYPSSGVSGGYLGQVCVQAGNTGTLSGVTGTVVSAPTHTITVNSAANLLPGDTITLTGGLASNVIASISGNVLTMVSSETSNLGSVACQFVPAVWQNYGSAGTVTSVSSGNLSPLFADSVSNSTTTPAITHTLSNAPANSVFGNNTSSSAAPAYQNSIALASAATNFSVIDTNTTAGGGATNVIGSSQAIYSSTSGAFANQVVGFQALAQVAAANTQDFTNTGGAIEGLIATTKTVSGANTYTISSLNNATFTVSNANASTTVTNAANLDILALINSGTVSNYCDLLLGEAAGTYPAGTWSIYDNSPKASNLAGVLWFDSSNTASSAMVSNGNAQLFATSNGGASIIGKGAFGDVTFYNSGGTFWLQNSPGATSAIFNGFLTVDQGNTAVTNPASNGVARAGATVAAGLILVGKGSSTDVTLENSGGTSWLSVATGTTNVTMPGKVVSYNGIAVVGQGLESVMAIPRQTAQTGAISLATFTTAAVDTTYRVSCNVNVTASITNNFTITCTYTDETNTSRVMTFPFNQLSGVPLTNITNVTGVGPYEGICQELRCKALTTIIFATVGTFTSVTYNFGATITQPN